MHRQGTGFSLIEAMTALAVLSIFLAIGIPSFSRLLLQHRAMSARYQLTYSLASARMAAVTYRQRVSVCPTTEDQRCRTDGIWEHGWMVFRDPARLGQPRNADDILTFVDRLDESLQLRSTQGRKLARFQPDGRSGGSTITLSLCRADNGQLLSQVILNNAGRSRIVEQNSEDRTCADAG